MLTTSVTNNLITFTDINTTYKSTIVKSKTNYMCTSGQFVDDINQKFSTFSFTVEGLVAGDENPSPLKAVNSSSRVQVGLFFKAR